MNRAEVDIYRTNVDKRLEDLSVINAEQNSELKHIRESVSEIKDLLKVQNGRIGRLEQSNARRDGVMTMVTVVFGTMIGWLFKMKG